MAGGLVVRGPIDEVPEIQAAREIFLVMNDIGLFPSEDDPDVYTYAPIQNSVWNTLANQVERWNPASQQMEPAPDLNGGFTTGDYKLRYYLVNGQPFFKEEHNFEPTTADYTPPPDCPALTSNQQDPIGTQLPVPRFTLQPGEVVRFRMLNANSDDLMPVVVEGHELHLLALDGVNFPAPRKIDVKPVTGKFGDEQLLLAPANRAEFLIQAGEPGLYEIVQLEQCAQFLRSVRRIIAEIEVKGDPIEPPMALPTELPVPSRHYPLIDPTDVKRRRNIVFSMAFPGLLNPIVGLDFMINNSGLRRAIGPAGGRCGHHRGMAPARAGWGPRRLGRAPLSCPCEFLRSDFHQRPGTATGNHPGYDLGGSQQRGGDPHEVSPVDRKISLPLPHPAP